MAQSASGHPVQKFQRMYPISTIMKRFHSSKDLNDLIHFEETKLFFSSDETIEAEKWRNLDETNKSTRLIKIVDGNMV